MSWKWSPAKIATPIAPSVRFKAAVYVLHAFKKKAKKGIATPKQEIELITRRLKTAETHYEATYATYGKA